MIKNENGLLILNGASISNFELKNNLFPFEGNVSYHLSFSSFYYFNNHIIALYHFHPSLIHSFRLTLSSSLMFSFSSFGMLVNHSEFFYSCNFGFCALELYRFFGGEIPFFRGEYLFFSLFLIAYTRSLKIFNI